MSVRLLVAALAAAVLIACADSAGDPLALEEAPIGAASIEAAVLAAAPAGTHGFTFLPPLMAAPTDGGAFDGSLLPHLRVDVCRVDGGVCDPVTSFSADGRGSDGIRRSEEDEHYIVQWSTGRQDVGLYRVDVLAGRVPLGSVMLDVVANGRALREVPEGPAGVVAGRTVPIKFRVEEGAIFVLGPDGGSVRALDGLVALDVPEGALPEPLPIAIRPTDPEDPEALLALELLPWDAGFLEPVTLTVHGQPLPIPYDLEATTEYVLEHDDTAGAWHEVASEYDFETGAVSFRLVTFALDPVELPEPTPLPDDEEGADPGAAPGDTAAMAGFFSIPVPRIPRFVPPRFRVPAPRPTRRRACVLSLRVVPSTLSLYVGESGSVLLEAARISRGGYLGLPMLSWYPLRPGSATWTEESELIDVEPGSVTGLDAGSAGYRVRYPAVHSPYCMPVEMIGRARVSHPPTASIAITPTEASLEVGETLALSTVLTSILDTDVTGLRPVVYASADEGIATVDPAGLVTAVGGGTATITATSDGKSARMSVTVAGSAAAVAAVSIAPDGGTVEVGQALLLTAELTSAAGQVLTRDVLWSAHPATGLSLVATGGSMEVTGQAEGTYTVTAESEGVSAGVTVIVLSPPTPPEPGTVAFFDGHFAPGDWTWLLVTHANGGTVAVTSEVSGGDPDGHMRIAQHFAAGFAPPNASHLFTFHARADAVHDPATAGEITSLDYSESSTLFGCEFTSCDGQFTGPALMQDGHVYAFVIGSTSYAEFLHVWRQQSSTGVTAAHFVLVMDASQVGVLNVDSSRHPDFSAAGSPIQFGFHRWGSHTNSLTPIRTAGIDNWSITLHTVNP